MGEYLHEMGISGYNADRIDAFHRFMLPWLLSSYGVPRDAVIMDVGAGHGHCLIPLQDKGYRNLIAVDRDIYCFEMFASRSIGTIKCDLDHEDIAIADSSVNAILCFHLIEHLFRPSNLMKEAKRLLAPGGIVFLVTPNWERQVKTFWRDPTHVRPYDKESMARMLRMEGFKAEVYSWNSAYGFGRLGLWRFWPRLGMIGADILAVGRKP